MKLIIYDRVHMLFLFLIPAAILGCGKEDDFLMNSDYSQGIYIINEGTYGYNNGSISYLDPYSGEITNYLFEKANEDAVTGDVIQSMAVIHDTIGYIVANGSSKIEIVNLKTFKTLTNPIQINYPRYCMEVNHEKGYVTRGNNQGYVVMINLNSHQKTDSIKVGFGPETMLLHDHLVFVANTGGGLYADSTISIINTLTDKVIDTIMVGQVPADMALDAENNLWVLCKGFAIYSGAPNYDLFKETDALIQKIDPETEQIVWQGRIGKAGDYFSFPKMAVSNNGEDIYYLRPDGIYLIHAYSPEIPVDPLIAGNFYGFDVDPVNNDIYAFEASFTGNGMVKIFDKNGSGISEGVVGILPNSAVFHMD
jgi:YVTN family beta-propeller protein